MEIYIVKSGDTVYRIAQAYGLGTEEIIYVNQLEEPYTLAVGQALLLLLEDKEQEKPVVRING